MLQFKNLSKSFVLLMAATNIFLYSCTKDSSTTPNVGGGGTTTTYKLAYTDSVLYPQGEQSTSQIVSPVTAKTGVYTAFPDGLSMDAATGSINIHESESGLRYRVYFTSSDGTLKDSTLITIAGVNFLDGVYKINTTDSIVNPVYNATIGNVLPSANSGSLFDEGGGCNSNGCAVDVNNAKINLAQTVRNGTFGSSPNNGSNKDFTLNFRVNDRSGKGSNKLKFKVFYFKTLGDVTQQVWDLLNSRNGTVVNSFNNSNNTPIQGFTANNIAVGSTTGKGRRPPCIVILTQ